MAKLKQFIPYGKQNIDEDDIAAVNAVLRSDLITQGPRVEEFEKRVAEYCGARYAVAFNSGTSALHAAVHAAGIGAEDEVITSPLTFAASANAVLYNGGRPVFADIDPDTYCLDVCRFEAAITHRTRAVIPVDYAGYPVDMEELLKVARRHDLLVIEDAAHALGARRAGKKVGTEADMTMFSFHPVKHITTGEGGMIVTDNEEFYHRLRQFRNHGIVKDAHLMAENHGPWYYEMQDLGYNFRITDIQCALGLSQLNKLEGFLQARSRIAQRYDQAFKGFSPVVIPPAVSEESRHAYHLYPLLLAESARRREFFDYMREKRIGVQVHYVPVHLHPYYRKLFGYRLGDFPAAEDFYQREVSLPVYPGLSEEEQDYVIDCVKAYFHSS
jgi:UDP-4-amino-4,6-dideoxy-N-acetyl-beta-L-altrosamine transaminase